MNIRLNGALHEVADHTTVEELITDVAGSTRGSAAVVDGVVVPRSSWASRTLRDGADVELITAVQGG